MSNKKILLATVGGQGGFKTICEEKPQEVYFLQTDRSKDTVDKIVQDLQNEEYLKEYFKDYDNCEDFVDSIIMYASNFNDKINRIDIGDHEKITETFVKTRSVILDLQKEDCEVIIDFTGGARPMAIGLYLAAMGEGCQYAYVSGERVDDLGVVKAGFEEVTKQIDPYQHYAIDEFNKGIQFFNRYQFDAAMTNFKLAKDKLSDKNLIERAELFIDIVRFYDVWDKFGNNVVDKVNLKSIPLDVFLKENILNRIDSSDNLTNYFNERNPEFYKQLLKNHSFLKLKLSSNDETILKDINYYLPDLLNNAKRRIKEGKYDDAVARLYRCIELVAQLNLNQYKVINEEQLKKSKTFEVNRSKIDKSINKLGLAKIDDYNIRGWNNKNIELLKFDSSTSYKVLDCISEGKNNDLSDKTKDIVNNYQHRLKNNIESRNNSILAHGLNPINEKKANDLFKMVDEHANKLFNIGKYREFAKFSQFKV